MSKIHRIAAAAALLAAPAQAAQKAHAIANLKTHDGKQAGQVDFATVNRGVLITFDLHDLPPGAPTGACAPAWSPAASAWAMANARSSTATAWPSRRRPGPTITAPSP
jgi:Cu/Zn superoxide dismutase